MPPTTPAEQQSPRTTFFYLAILVPTTFILILLGFYFWNMQRSSPEPEKPNQTYLDLKDSQEFQAAQRAMKQKNYLLAVSLFQQVQTATQDEYSFVQYEIANARININRQDGVVAFSNLVASSSINSQTKGYAINALGRTYSSSHDEAIVTTLKNRAATWGASEELVKNFTSATSSNNSFIGLLELGSSYYPIMDSEMRLAYLYAKIANEAKERGDTPVFEEYRDKALAKLTNADTDPNKTRLSENLSWMIPLAMNRKAVTLEILERLGVAGEDPAIYFEQALNLSKVQGVPVQPFILFNYSVYLMKNTSGNENSEKIISLLQPIVASKDSPDLALFFEFTKNAFKNNEATNIQDLNNLAKIYPPFGEIIK